MQIVKITKDNIRELGTLVANFRVSLRSYKGISSTPNPDEGREEMIEYIDSGFPVFAALNDGKYVGYIVCRVEEPCVWVESIYVSEEYRRQGIASALYEKAEDIAHSYGEETVYNYVHPNNYGMIEFLRKKDYTVLNLIEIRKAHKNEQLKSIIKVGDTEFDYWKDLS